MDVDVSQLVNKEVCYLEPSPQEKSIKAIQSQPGKLYTDEVYPPDAVSLKGEEMVVKGWDQITWRRVSDLIPNPQIFRGRLSPNDIEQGMLGDCYYLAALAALA